jgi:hypothetical protein
MAVVCLNLDICIFDYIFELSINFDYILHVEKCVDFLKLNLDA